MKKVAELRQELNQLVNAQEALATGAQKENRSMNADENSKFDELQTQITEKRAELARSEAYEDNIKQRAAAGEGESVFGPDGNPQRRDARPGGEARELDKMKGKYSIHKVIRAQMPNGDALSGVELEFHQEGLKRASHAGVATSGIVVPSFEKRADGQTVTQDSGGYGGNLVPTQQMTIIDALRPNPVLAQVGATYLTGLSGNLKFPVNSGGIAATWEGEVDTVAASKNAYGSKTMSPKRLAATVLISLQNIMQSSIDLELYTANEIRNVIGLAIDTAGINGSGTSDQPTGILNTSGINDVVGGTDGALPTWANIIDLETKVFIENANAARMSYLINPKTQGRLKITKHEAGDLGYLMALDKTINGYNVGVSNLVPGNLTKGTASAICSAILFGDFSQLYIGDWAFMDLSVDDKSQKKNGYIEITANKFVDVMVRQAKAFSAMKDALTA